MPDEEPVTRTARETGSAMAREHRPRSAAGQAGGPGRQARRRGAPGAAGGPGLGPEPVPGRTGVTFGYMNCRIIVLLRRASRVVACAIRHCLPATFGVTCRRTLCAADHGGAGAGPCAGCGTASAGMRAS